MPPFVPIRSRCCRLPELGPARSSPAPLLEADSDGFPAVEGGVDPARRLVKEIGPHFAGALPELIRFDPDREADTLPERDSSRDRRKDGLRNMRSVQVERSQAKGVVQVNCDLMIFELQRLGQLLIGHSWHHQGESPTARGPEMIWFASRRNEVSSSLAILKGAFAIADRIESTSS